MTKCFTDVTLDFAMELVKLNGCGLVTPTIFSIDPQTKTTRVILESDNIDPSLEGKVIHFSITKDAHSNKLIILAKEV